MGVSYKGPADEHWQNEEGCLQIDETILHLRLNTIFPGDSDLRNRLSELL